MLLRGGGGKEARLGLKPAPLNLLATLITTLGMLRKSLRAVLDIWMGGREVVKVTLTYLLRPYLRHLLRNGCHVRESRCAILQLARAELRDGYYVGRIGWAVGRWEKVGGGLALPWLQNTSA